MNQSDDHLETLLRAAGQSAPAAAIGSPDLAERVRRTDKHRRRVRIMSLTTVTAASLVAAVVLLRANDPPADSNPGSQLARESTPQETLPQDPKPTVSPEKIAQMRAEIAALREEAERCRQMAQLLIQQEELRQLARYEAENRRLDPAIDAKVQREVTAFLMVDFAQSRSGDMARREYQRVISLFPNTKAAASARDELQEFSL